VTSAPHPTDAILADARVLEDAVADVLDRANNDPANRDLPYRAVLLRMAREVIAVVKDHPTLTRSHT